MTTFPPKLESKEDRIAEKLRRNKTAPINKFKILYSLMDELLKALNPFLPCKKGCTACCYYNVSVSEIEVAYIEKYTKYRRTKKVIAKQDFHGQPCPFLQNGACSIYNARPFVCRRHHALTQNSFWCHHDHSNNEEFPTINFSSINKAFKEIRIETKDIEPNDIRQYFSVRNSF